MPFPELNDIKKKVWAISTESISDIVANRGLYRYSDIVYERKPVEMNNTSDRRISTSALERYPSLFLSEKPVDGNDYIQIYGNYHGQRVYRWFRKEYLSPVKDLYLYKVMLPKANGSGSLGEVLSTPLIGQP